MRARVSITMADGTREMLLRKCGNLEVSGKKSEQKTQTVMKYMGERMIEAIQPPPQTRDKGMKKNYLISIQPKAYLCEHLHYKFLFSLCLKLIHLFC